MIPLSEHDMRPYAVGIVLLAVPGVLLVYAADGPVADRVDRLVKQLGHPEFAEREAATRELDAIGEPALDALRKAATDQDAEVRQRAERVLRAVTGRVRAAAGKKELARWEGAWQGIDRQVLLIKGDRWLWTGEAGPFEFDDSTWNRIANVEARETATHADLVVGDPAAGGRVCRAIFRLDGDTLHYCGTYDATRPTEFKATGNNFYVAWKRVAKGGGGRLLPPALRFASDAFSTDLTMPESKAAVHRVTVEVPPADGGDGTLTLDPTVPTFDAFGDPAAGGGPSPAVTLDCTLTLVKAEKGRRRYGLRGPKVVSRLSLVVYDPATPAGDARLLVHGRGGEVRSVIDLRLPRQPQQQLLLPCHPGCFPAGTGVHVPGGKKVIEKVREGDLVLTIDAEGTPKPARVAGVFATRNRLLEVRTEGRTLVTTATQPVGLEGGGFRAAGELKPGDRVWQWIGDKRQAVPVREVTAAVREAEVFNLILGEPTGFVAGDFLVRSKPPAGPQPP
jgi:hypothetical protein